MLTSANVTKSFIGITMISVSQGISQVGIYGSFVGLAYVTALNIYSLWIVIQARNRFKYDRIVDLPDLSARLFGEKARYLMEFILVLNQLLFLMCYNLYFGTQLDQLMCQTLEIYECGR